MYQTFDKLQKEIRTIYENNDPTVFTEKQLKRIDFILNSNTRDECIKKFMKEFDMDYQNANLSLSRLKGHLLETIDNIFFSNKRKELKFLNFQSYLTTLYEEYKERFTPERISNMNLALNSLTFEECCKNLEDIGSTWSDFTTSFIRFGRSLGIKISLIVNEENIDFLSIQKNAYHLYQEYQDVLTLQQIRIIKVMIDSKDKKDCETQLYNEFGVTDVLDKYFQIKHSLELIQPQEVVTQEESNESYLQYQQQVREFYEKEKEELTQIEEKVIESILKARNKTNGVHILAKELNISYLGAKWHIEQLQNKILSRVSKLKTETIRLSRPAENFNPYLIFNVSQKEAIYWYEENNVLSKKSKELFCKFYGIGMDPVSLRELAFEYEKEELALASRLSYILCQLIIKKGKSKIPGIENQKYFSIRENISKVFSFEKDVLTFEERDIIGTYYGLTGPRKSINYLCRKYSKTPEEIKIIILNTVKEVLNPRRKKNIQMLNSIKFVVNNDWYQEYSDIKIRALRLVVIKKIKENRNILPLQQLEMLKEFYGIGYSSIKSTKELATKYHLEETDIQYYLIEGLRGLFNYSESNFMEDFTFEEKDKKYLKGR